MSYDPILDQFLEEVPDLIFRAGEITRRYFRRSDLRVDYKGDAGPVTEADRETERFLTNEIGRRFPGHGIVGEEFGATERREWTWIIDPIDGTKAFVHGIPLYTVLIALTRGARFVAGAIRNPVTDETVIAAEGRGCFHNGRPTHVREARPLKDATICVTDYADLYRRDPAFAGKLLSEVDMARTWADGYGYLLVATGTVDAALDPIMSIWDIAPLVPIIREAGGTITEWNGQLSSEPASAIVAAPELHREILALGPSDYSPSA
ncbi:MAG: inositol monophosphatase family protein [Spirochaetaceae bacterium]